MNKSPFWMAWVKHGKMVIYMEITMFNRQIIYFYDQFQVRPFLVYQTYLTGAVPLINQMDRFKQNKNQESLFKVILTIIEGSCKIPSNQLWEISGYMAWLWFFGCFFCSGVSVVMLINSSRCSQSQCQWPQKSQNNWKTDVEQRLIQTRIAGLNLDVVMRLSCNLGKRNTSQQSLKTRWNWPLNQPHHRDDEIPL